MPCPKRQLPKAVLGLQSASCPHSGREAHLSQFTPGEAAQPYSGNIQSLFQLKRKVSGFWKDEKPEKTVLKEGVWSGNERSWMNLDEWNSRGTWRKRKWEEGREVITLEIRTKIWKDDFWTDLQRKVSKTWKQEKKELRARDDKTKDIYSRGRRRETDS